MEVWVAILLFIVAVLGITILMIKAKKTATKVIGGIGLSIMAILMLLYVIAAVILVNAVD